MSRLATGDDLAFARRLQMSVARHSLCWLAAANVVGVWLALLLIYPELGRILGEFSYGRWMPLHLNWHLYGWCSLPAVGALLRRFLPPTENALLQAQWVLRLWSIALALGGWSWLHGQTSGKLFLDWTGFARVVFLVVLVILWAVLAWNYWGSARVRAARTRKVVLVETVLLTLLTVVPGILFWASGRSVHPPIDPGTGGPTGASLLGSTLVIVLVIGLLPKALFLVSGSRLVERWYWVLLGGNCSLFLSLHGAPADHASPRQILGLGSLIMWVPMGWIYLCQFGWAKPSRPWLLATVGWWALLIISGFAIFLPGVLDACKFTHALVAHAHLAMAGLLTSLNVLLLSNLAAANSIVTATLGHRPACLVWQAALLLHLLALLWLAGVEIREPGNFVSGVHPAFWARLVAGMAMAAVSLRWALRLLSPNAFEQPSD